MCCPRDDENMLIFSLILILRKFFQINANCDVLVDDRNECGYPGISKTECLDRNCCWVPFSASDLRNPPWCSSRTSNSCGYSLFTNHTLKDRCNESNITSLFVDYPYKDVLRVKIIRSENEFQIPDQLYPKLSIVSNHSELEYKSFKDENGNFNFKIDRISSNETIWNTDLQDDQFASSIKMKYLYTQIGSKLPLNHAIYGLGYHTGKLKINPGQILALYARDSPTVENQNLYGAHPFYIQVQNGKAHGVVLRIKFIVEYNCLFLVSQEFVWNGCRYQ